MAKKGKPEGIVIAVGKSDGDDDYDEDRAEMKEAAAEDLIQAIKDEDAADVADAYQALYEICRKK